MATEEQHHHQNTILGLKLENNVLRSIHISKKKQIYFNKGTTTNC